MALFSRIGVPAGLIAAATFMAVPASAAELPAGLAPQPGDSAAFTSFDTTPFDTTTFDSEADTNEWRRGRWGRWGRGGWGCGWRCRRRGVGIGGVLAGVAVVGGIAAIANANNNRRRRPPEVIVVERDRDRDFDRRDWDRDRNFDQRNFDPRNDRQFNSFDRGGASSGGLNNAVDMCVSQVEQNVRVDGVDSVDRTARGWIVSGRLFNGSGFTCRLNANGQIDGIDYGNGNQNGFRQMSAPAFDQSQVDGQWDDRVYMDARQQRSERGFNAGQRPAQPLVPMTSGRVSAYPGGPPLDE